MYNYTKFLKTVQVKKRLRSIDKNQYFKTANLHAHSTYSDGRADFEALVKQAHDMGLLHFAICDHNTVEGYLKMQYQNDDMLIPAVEFDCISGHCILHIIGYGIDPYNEDLQKICAKDKTGTGGNIRRIFRSRSPKKVIDTIHKAGGVAVLAHPCCCWVLNLERFIKKLVNMGLDGVEIYYPYKRHRGIVKFHSRKYAKEIAQKYDLILTGGTDEHGDLKP